MINTIDKVALYPFSPLKLLHETRKMTAAQAKFFVALMCLYFERGGALDWYGGDEEKQAALYAPYCGVTKRTFIKMIDVLQAAGVVYLNDCGQITPIIAQEIREAVKSGSHTIMTCDETDAGVKVEAVAAVKAAVSPVTQEQEKEGVAVAAEARFQGTGEQGSGEGRDNNVRNASRQSHVDKEDNAAYDPLNIDWEAKGMSLEERREEIKQKIEIIKEGVTQQGWAASVCDEYTPFTISKRILFEARQLVRDDPRLTDLLEPLMKKRDEEHKIFFEDDFVEDWVTPKVWERMPGILYGDKVFMSPEEFWGEDWRQKGWLSTDPKDF